LPVVTIVNYTCHGRSEFTVEKGMGEGKLSGVKVSRLLNILHLFFIDDVLIFSKASVEEWSEIKRILTTFCRASGLCINWSKSLFYHSGIFGDYLDSLKSIFSTWI